MGLAKYLGEYTIVKTIGQGAFSKVKLAIHRESNEKVAIKIIDKEMMRKMVEKQKEAAVQRRKKREQEADEKNKATGVTIPADATLSKVMEKLKESQKPAAEEPTVIPEREKGSALFIDNLQKEVQLMMRLNHPNIIKIYQVIESETECYIVMEHAKGELTDYLAVRERLSETQTRKFFRQLISAIDHCHEADVVHRDLKLENLLISETGELLVSDFGLGRGYRHQDILSEVVFFNVDILWYSELCGAGAC
jgi:serine/threonine protein kinase